jgi:hypothetical protein
MLGFNPSSMTENELYEARSKFSRILGGALMTGNSAVELIQNYIDMVNTELSDRAFIQNFNEWNKVYPEKIITDPKLAEANKPHDDFGKKPSRRQPFITASDLKMARTRQPKPHEPSSEKKD